MKRFDPIPLVQPGGVQPYHGSTPSEPGPSLLAMMRGTTFGGINPMDPMRQMQSASRGRRRATLLDTLGR